jgi:ribosomal protein L12E/L44/L45/RPP1/RPP2
MDEPKSYSIEKLNETNYRSWSQVLESHLDDQDLWELVKNLEKKPERPSNPTTSTSTAQTTEQTEQTTQTTQTAAATTEEYEKKLEEWTKKAKKARKLIISTISASVMTYVEGERNPAEMWRILEERYKPKTRVTLRQLQRQFNTIKMADDDGDMEKHLQKVERVKRQIEEQGEKVSDSNYISILLNCAPPRYNVVISILEAQDEVTPQIIINRLLEEYRKFQAVKEEVPKQALLTNQRQSTNQKHGNRKGKSSSSSKPHPTCNFCNKGRHKEDQCWLKHPELRPERDGQGIKAERPRYSMTATVRSSKRQSSPNDWYTDSGASDHFSPFKQLFETFEELDEPTEIETAEGIAIGTAKGTVIVTVIGEGDVETELRLEDVIYAPSMGSNLFSLMRAYDLGYETRITPGYGVRIFNKDGKVIAKSTRDPGGLFRLKTPSANQYAMTAQASESTPELDVNIWHRRLAHLGEEKVRKLSKLVEGMKIKFRTSVGVCAACLEGKQHRQPSRIPAKRAKEALELVHCDLCGPIDPVSAGGAIYFILFIDDFTRMTYIYPLSGKSSADVLQRFKEYQETTNGRRQRIRQSHGATSQDLRYHS